MIFVITLSIRYIKFYTLGYYIEFVKISVDDSFHTFNYLGRGTNSHETLFKVQIYM